jgi:alkylation response protein AidB-like acyl-CoA dehydrogenase
VNFAMDDDVLVLVDSIADFFDRRGDARAIADAAAKGVSADRERWTALCQMGLPVLRLPEPNGIGAGLLESTAVAEKIGAVLLPEPAVAMMVLASAWSSHPRASELLETLCDGTRITMFNGFEAGILSPAGAFTGRLGMPTDGAVDSVAVLAADEYTGGAALATFEVADHRAHVTSSSLDPTRMTATIELAGVEPVDVLRLADGVAERIRNEYAVLTLAELVGTMQQVLTATKDFVATREQFGRAIGSFQAIKHRIADMYAFTEQARALVQLAAIECAAAGDQDGSTIESATRWVPRAAISVCEDAIHLHGAMGYSWEVGVHLHLRRALSVSAALETFDARLFAPSRARAEAV